MESPMYFTGVRVSGIKETVTEKDIKIHFSNPKNGGGHVCKIFYPLLGNDAVLFYDNNVDISKVCLLHQPSTHPCFLAKPLPKQVFSKVEAELLPSMCTLVSSNSAIVDDIRYYADIHMSHNYQSGSYRLVGDIYQIEWAMQYLGSMAIQMAQLSPQPLKRAQILNERRVSNPNMDDANIPRNAVDAEHTAHDIEHVSTDLRNNCDQLREQMEQVKIKENSPLLDDSENEDDDSELDSYEDFEHLPFTRNERMVHSLNQHVQDRFSAPYTDFGESYMTCDFQVNTILVKIQYADITKSRTDGIVSPTDEALSHSFGISNAIAREAGLPLISDCRKIIQEHGMLKVADVCHTCAGGSLDKRVGYVLHASVPTWSEDESEKISHLLTVTYMNCMQYANFKLWMKSLTFPLIGAGMLGIPLDVCIQSFHDALQLSVVDDRKMRHLSEIQLVGNDIDSISAVIVILRSLLEMEEGSEQNSAVERYINLSNKFNFYAKDFQLIVSDAFYKDSKPDKDTASFKNVEHDVIVEKQIFTSDNIQMTTSFHERERFEQNVPLKQRVYPCICELGELSINDDSSINNNFEVDTVPTVLDRTKIAYGEGVVEELFTGPVEPSDYSSIDNNFEVDTVPTVLDRTKIAYGEGAVEELFTGPVEPSDYSSIDNNFEVDTVSTEELFTGSVEPVHVGDEQPVIGSSHFSRINIRPQNVAEKFTMYPMLDNRSLFMKETNTKDTN